MRDTTSSVPAGLDAGTLSVGAFLLILLGCGGPADAPHADPSATRTLVPDRLIGEVTGVIFGQLGDLVAFADGSVAVADQGESRILHLDPDGRVLATWGRRGRGPGEFQRISRLWGLGSDSLLAYDFHSRRITIIDRRRGIVAHFAVQVPPGFTGYAEPIGATAESYVLGGGVPITPADPPVMDRGPRPLYVMQSDTLRSVLTGYQSIEAFRGRGRDVLSLPLGRNTLFFVGSDRVYSLDTVEDTVRIRSLAGQPMAVVGLGIAPRALTKEEVRVDRRYRIAEHRRMFAGQGVPESYVASQEQALEQVPYPSFWPTASDLLVDHRGRLWLRRDISPALSDHPLWEVYGRDGAFLARFRIEGTARISVPRDGHFWAVQSDSAGAPRIARYPLAALALP